MHRFFLSDVVEAGAHITITGQDARHIGQVLRLRAGDTVEAVGTCGNVATARIERIEPAQVIANVESVRAGGAEPPVSLVLAQGLPKGDKMDYIVQKAVELGIASVIPMSCEQSVVRYEQHKAAARVERWQTIAREAAKQAKRDIVPAVLPVKDVKQVLAECPAGTCIVMLYEGRTPASLRELLAKQSARSYLLLIGPEGGFSSAEVSLCQAAGAHVVTLGPRILRTETASLAAVSIILYEQGDLGGMPCLL